MITREEFSKLLRIKFIDWDGSNSTKTKNLIATIKEYENKSFFGEEVERFQEFINSRDCKNPCRYSSYNFLDARLVFERAEFKELKKKICNVLKEAPVVSSSTAEIKATTSSSTVLSICKFVWENKWLILIPIILYASVSQANAEENKFESKNDDALIPFNSYSQNHSPNPICHFDGNSLERDIYTTQPDLINNYENLENDIDKTQLDPEKLEGEIDITQLSPEINYEFLLEKISLNEPYSASDKSYASKLTPEKVLEKRKYMANFILSLMKEKGNAEKISRVMNSEDFKLIVVDNFANDPYAVGKYSYYRNKMFVRDSENYFCSDYKTTFLHELHHADIAITNTDNKPIQKYNEIKGKQNKNKQYDPIEPFSTDKEREELDVAIAQGFKRIFGNFTQLHEKALKKELIGDELKKYKEYTTALSDYQPRCIGHVIYNSSPEYQFILKKLNKGERITRNGKPFYPLHYEESSNMLIIFGNYVKDLSTSKRRATAFLMDTDYVKNEFARMYDPEGTKPGLRTCEEDAEIHGDGPKVIDTFYPEARDYHILFRKKNEMADTAENEKSGVKYHPNV